MHSVALVAFAAVAAASSWSGQPIPSCGWTTTLITEAGHTDTVPIPLASAQCSGMTTMPAPVTTPAPASMSSPSAPMSSPSAPMSSAPAPMSSPPAPSPPAPSSMMQCTEYTDGQPQCSMVPVPACSEYVDGQPQCASTMAPMPMSTGMYPTGGYGTGSYMMPTGTGVMPYSSSIVPAIGGAPTNGPVVGLLAAAGFAVAML